MMVRRCEFPPVIAKGASPEAIWSFTDNEIASSARGNPGGLRKCHREDWRSRDVAIPWHLPVIASGARQFRGRAVLTR